MGSGAGSGGGRGCVDKEDYVTAKPGQAITWDETGQPPGSVH
jgi:hypothetical protein